MPMFFYKDGIADQTTLEGHIIKLFIGEPKIDKSLVFTEMR